MRRQNHGLQPAVVFQAGSQWPTASSSLHSGLSCPWQLNEADDQVQSREGSGPSASTCTGSPGQANAYLMTDTGTTVHIHRALARPWLTAWHIRLLGSPSLRKLGIQFKQDLHSYCSVQALPALLLLDAYIKQSSAFHIMCQKSQYQYACGHKSDVQWVPLDPADSSTATRYRSGVCGREYCSKSKGKSEEGEN
ncbi:hypothetical protein ACRALDRAFT_211467 [Sodiomyces alcalophilus JCM 7366]|uniref:uncharacterized protein n=1 Tax=Sodiomyces alcalophilus JCM 7366 TaxID=591952 RepID=UPI0039B3CADA